MTLSINRGASTNDLFDAPFGTIVEMYGNRYVKEADGWHTATGGGGDVFGPANINGATVQFIGTRTSEETLPQFQQRLRTVCIGRATQSGVDLHPVHIALSRLGIPEFGLLPGMYVHWRDDRLRRGLPLGTLLMCGDPNEWDSLGVWTVQGEAVWTHVFGSHSRIGSQALRVFEYPAGTTVEDWPVVEGDQRALIASLKAQAWDVGVAAKRSSSWCGDFEQAMGRLDIDASVRARMERAGITLSPVPPTDAPTRTVTEADTVPVGTRVSADAEVNALPDGAVMRYPDATTDDNHWNMTIRTDSPGPDHSGTWRTEHLVGPNSGRWGGDPVVVYNGVGDMAILCASTREMTAMPEGTVIQRHPSDTANTWVKVADGRWQARTTGNHRRTEDFIPSNFVYRFIPGDRGVDAGRDPAITPAPLSEVGAFIGTVEQNALPEGAIVRWDDESNVGSFSMFYRTETSRLPARTAYLCGPAMGQWTNTVEVVWPGVGELSVVVRSREEMDHMPVGTQITEGAMWWTKADHGNWVNRNIVDTAGAGSRAFVLSDTFRYTYIPLPNGSAAGVQK